jgi:hypothetical protein
MLPMSESFVDLTYRGLSLGRRVKLSNVRPTTGYVEMPAPMPVGTQIAILTDDTVALEAVVVEIHEQVAGSEHAPGMVLRPRLDGDAAKQWWQKRVTLPDAERKSAPVLVAPEPPAPVVVVSKRMTNPGLGVPELVDDGRDTGVMDAVDIAQEEAPKTIAMAAVDLQALGLSTGSGEMTAVSPPPDDDTNGDGNGDKPAAQGGGGKRRRKRR